MAFEGYKPTPENPYLKLLGKVVLFQLVTGGDVLMKVQAVDTNKELIFGWGDERQWLKLHQDQISDYVITH